MNTGKTMDIEGSFSIVDIQSSNELQNQIAQKLLHNPSEYGVGFDIAAVLLKDLGIVNIDEKSLQYYLSPDILLMMQDNQELGLHRLHVAFDDLDKMIYPDDIIDTSDMLAELSQLFQEERGNKKTLDDYVEKYSSLHNISKVLYKELSAKFIQQWKSDIDELQQILGRHQADLEENNLKLEQEGTSGSSIPEVAFESIKLKKTEGEKKIKSIKEEIKTIESHMQGDHITNEGMKQQGVLDALVSMEEKVVEINDAFERLNTDIGTLQKQLINLNKKLNSDDEKNLDTYSIFIGSHGSSISILQEYLSLILEKEKKYSKIMLALSEISEGQDITNISPELQKTLGSEHAYNIMSAISGIVSGTTTAVGLSQVVPQFLYVNELFLNIDGTPSTWVVGIASVIPGILAYIAGSSIVRGRAKAGIQAEAMKPKSALGNQYQTFKGSVKGLFLDVHGKFNLMRSLVSVAALSIVVSIVVPTKDGGLLNAGSIPSNMSGGATLFLGDNIRKQSRIDLVEAATEGQLSIEKIQRQISNATSDMSLATDQFVQNEIAGGGINGIATIGPVASIKNRVVHGRLLKGKFSSVYNKLITDTRFARSSFDLELKKINNRYQSDIGSFFESFNVEEFDRDLKLLLEDISPLDVFTLSIDLKEQSKLASNKYATLIDTLNNYVGSLNQLSQDTKDVLTNIEKQSGNLGAKDTLEDKFLPNIEKIDIKTIQQASEEIQKNFAEMDPFIIDLRNALSKATDAKYTKELLVVFILVGILMEILVIMLLGPTLLRGERKRFDKISERLSKKYRDFVTSAQSHGLLANNVQPLPGDELFNGKIVYGNQSDSILKRAFFSTKRVFNNGSKGNPIQDYSMNMTQRVIEIIQGALIGLDSLDSSIPVDPDLVISLLHDVVEYRDPGQKKKLSPSQVGAEQIIDLTEAISGDNIRGIVQRIMSDSRRNGDTNSNDAIMSSIQNGMFLNELLGNKGGGIDLLDDTEEVIIGEATIDSIEKENMIID